MPVFACASACLHTHVWLSPHMDASACLWVCEYIGLSSFLPQFLRIYVPSTCVPVHVCSCRVCVAVCAFLCVCLCKGAWVTVSMLEGEAGRGERKQSESRGWGSESSRKGWYVLGRDLKCSCHCQGRGEETDPQTVHQGLQKGPWGLSLRSGGCSSLRA